MFSEYDLRQGAVFSECAIGAIQEQARLLARRVLRPTCVALYGAMGSGKTTFAKSFIQAYCNDDSLPVVSPTFTIIQTYKKKHVHLAKHSTEEVWHVDLYRIKDSAEMLELGLEEALFNNVCLVEWPEKISGIDLPRRVNVFLNIMSASTRALFIRYL
ncbi:MAG: tRNA (adenosine(37)-N6)-threonylcarbamoyltransferase complex ATPase subunit type 1 TsaE [Holosporales bacterium]|nr:tRNA (adenosine(37)-N6)-threonylcarbamoyltransferase complex ATPase subunit type 1 TsaE [Holosporales bacterium]